MVDDEIDLVRSTVEMLRKEFAPTQVIGTSDPREAMAQIERERPSVLITDIRMPHVNGLELIIHTQKKWSNVPVIAITAFPSAEVAAHSRFSGFTYLQKPVSFKTLREIIANLSDVPVAAFRGAIATTTLADVVQLYAMSSQIGLISVEYDDQRGEIWLDQGRVVHAEAGGWTGNNAFYKIMTWPRGSFSWQSCRPKQVSMHVSLTELLLEAYRLKDEQAQWLQALEGEPPKDAASSEARPAASPQPSGEDDDFSGLFDESEELPQEETHPSTVAQTLDLTEEVELVESDTNNVGTSAAGTQEERTMALTSNNIKENLMKLEAVDGFIGAALADSDSGMCLGFVGGTGVLNLEVAAASNSEVVRSKRKAMKALGLRDDIEDILITLGKQYHLIRPLKTRPNVFFYMALDRSRSNLAMARYALADVERELAL